MMVGEIKNSRPVPVAVDEPTIVLPTDVVIMAVGQAIDSGSFAEEGFAVDRSARIQAGLDGSIDGYAGVFSGGDCVSGPKSAIAAIASGKAAARNIDTFLGFDHVITTDVEIPTALAKGKPYCARSNMTEKIPGTLTGNFTTTECGLEKQEGLQEAQRCLRCDHFGLGALREGRSLSW
jgi:NADPH-dependent glutamate synthase beta subunit-like oxidoreductase